MCLNESKSTWTLHVLWDLSILPPSYMLTNMMIFVFEIYVASAWDLGSRVPTHCLLLNLCKKLVETDGGFLRMWALHSHYSWLVTHIWVVWWWDVARLVDQNRPKMTHVAMRLDYVFISYQHILGSISSTLGRRMSLIEQETSTSNFYSVCILNMLLTFELIIFGIYKIVKKKRQFLIRSNDLNCIPWKLPQ